MELEAIPVASSPDEFELYLTSKLNQQQETILNGKVRFGLRGGELKLSLENASMSAIVSSLSPSFEKVKNALTIYPTWIIRAKPGEKFIHDHLTQVKLGTIKIKEQPYQLRATFTVKGAHLHLTDIEGLWRHDITPNKHGVLERKLASFLLQTKLNPYLSQTVLGSPDFSFQPSSSHQQPEEASRPTTSELTNILQIVYQAPTNDFLELAKIAGLNPLTDLAGGNLVGAELSGVDLNSANLQCVNLRGADLTDADLSEANLSYAILSGADLSGAYLEGANLHHANLHSASLALANLIGADLTAANLQDTNLTNTTFANAKLTGAVFANNTGLSEENRQSLQARGAGFSP
jgi:uncharacterized protein YjbI with pentapeptide repeats